MTETESQSVRLTRDFAASPSRVFDAWVNAAPLERWLAPHAEVDARQGGKFRLTVTKPEGDHIVSGEYLEFLPSERLLMTWDYEGPMAPEEKMEALLTVDFAPKGDGAAITLRHERLTNAQYLETMRHGAWSKALDALEKFLA